jgi:hypothetical protein
VPYRSFGQQLDVRLSRNTVEIYDGPSLVTSHVRRPTGRATCLEHYPQAAQAYLRATPTACQRQAQAIGPATTELVAGLLASGTLCQRRAAQAVLRLAATDEPERRERAGRRALAAGDGWLRPVRELLERGRAGIGPEERPVPQSGGAYLRGPAAFGEVR